MKSAVSSVDMYFKLKTEGAFMYRERSRCAAEYDMRSTVSSVEMNVKTNTRQEEAF